MDSSQAHFIVDPAGGSLLNPAELSSSPSSFVRRGCTIQLHMHMRGMSRRTGVLTQIGGRAEIHHVHVCSRSVCQLACLNRTT